MTDATASTATTDSTAATSADTPAPAEAATQETAAQQQDQTDLKPATEGDAAKDDAAKEGEENKKAEGPPEAYTFELPDGVELNADISAEFTTIAKELEMPQEKAQAVVDLGVKLAQGWATAQAEAIEAVQAEWRATAEADPEIGGDKLAESLAASKRVLDKFGNEAFRQVLEDTKLGDHAEVIRFMANVAKVISEDSMVTPSGTAAAAPKSHAERIFGPSS